MIQIFGLARVGRDVEVRYTQGGDAVASVSLAFDYGRKGDDGKKPTAWLDASLWGKRAEALAPYLVKGTKVTVVCEDAHIETFKKSDGTEGVKLVARITAIDLAGGGQQQQQAPQQRQQPQRQAQPAAAKKVPAGGGFEEMDDDIPF